MYTNMIAIAAIVTLVSGILTVFKTLLEIIEKRRKIPPRLLTFFGKIRPFAFVGFMFGLGLGAGIWVSHYQESNKSKLSDADVAKINDLLREAMTLYQRGHSHGGYYYEAQDIYLQVLAIQPRNIPALLGRGRTSEGLKNFAIAKEYYRLAVEFEPFNTEALRLLGGMMYETGEFKEAIKVIQKAVDLDSEHPLSRYQLGQAYLRLWRNEGRFELDDNFKRAESETIACINLGKDYVHWAYYNIGTLYALRLKSPTISNEDKKVSSIKAIQNLKLSLERAKKMMPRSEAQEIVTYILPKTSSSDPDLNELRKTTDFMRFVSESADLSESQTR